MACTSVETESWAAKSGVANGNEKNTATHRADFFVVKGMNTPVETELIRESLAKENILHNIIKSQEPISLTINSTLLHSPVIAILLNLTEYRNTLTPTEIKVF